MQLVSKFGELTPVVYFHVPGAPLAKYPISYIIEKVKSLEKFTTLRVRQNQKKGVQWAQV